MARFRLDSIADLARQMTFTPARARSAQLASAETLLHTLDPAKAYPLEFIVFRITGYHPKTAAADLLTGLALQHDLGQLIEIVSDSLDLKAAEAIEPILQIDDVCERFNVTSKTIQRWRRKGLAARRFIFADGKRRVGFMLSSVERYLATHQEQVTRGANFSQVTGVERDDILRRARKLAGACGCVTEISRRVARRAGRSPLTVQHIIKKHDADHPAEAIFAAAVRPVGDDERGRILRGHRRGLTLSELARRTCRPRSIVYRVLIDERLGKLLDRKVKFIDDPLYHQDEAESVINQIAAAGELPGRSDPESSRVPKGLPPYLAELYRTPLLSANRERALFLKFNFHKWQFVSLRRRIDPSAVRVRDVNRLEAAWRKVVDAKNALVRANLRLVVSIARKHLRPSLNLMELISDGNLTLLRAVESFDTHKGNKFSTYASLALMKGFARSVPLMLAGRAVQSTDADAIMEVADPRPIEQSRLADREQIRTLLRVLDPAERQALLSEFGLIDPPTGRADVTPTRTRQISEQALRKLRAAVEESTN